MPAKDTYHEAVKAALTKESWRITHDPYTIKYKGTKLYADLAAERTLAAEREGKKIIVEIKTFAGLSLMSDLEKAIGQYFIYRQLIDVTAPEYTLYLAVSENVYLDFFQRPAVELVIRNGKFLLIVVEIEQEVITRWIS
ncbi:MAG: XisH family protein [Geitlerinemataceae cyanobacterium]